MPTPITWIAGLGGSALVHALGFGVYLLTSTVEEPPDQSGPESKLELDTVSAKTQKADAQTPDVQDVDNAEANSTDLDAGAIRQSTAEALSAPLDSATSISPQANQIAPSNQKAAAVNAAQPVSQSLNPTSAQTSRIAEASLDSQNATSQRPVAADVTASVTPQSDAVAEVEAASADAQASAPVAADIAAALAQTDPVALVETEPTVLASAARLPSLSAQTAAPAVVDADIAAPQTIPVAQSRPNGDDAQQGSTQGDPAPQTVAKTITPNEPPLPAGNAKADLAWQFGDRLVTDPQALATIQAFMAPNALDGADDVKDGLSNVLTDIDCARLSATFVPETGSLEMRGHIPDPSLRDSILASMQAQVGDGIPVTTNLLHLPAPQCGALTGIADVGLPQSTDQFTNQRLIGANAHAAEFPYTEGARFQFEFTAPEYDAVVYVDYFDADGKVVHLQPNLTGIDGVQKANSVVGVFPKQPGTDNPIVIGPPFGQEIAVAFAASEKLYDTPRPIIEDAEPYLAWLKDRVADARARNPDFKGEWVYFFITTRPASQ